MLVSSGSVQRLCFLCSFIKVELFDVCGKNYGLTINNLYAAISPAECTVKVSQAWSGLAVQLLSDISPH